MRRQLVEVRLKSGKTIEILPEEVSVLRSQGKLIEEDQEEREVIDVDHGGTPAPEDVSQETITLPAINPEPVQSPALTSKQRKERIRKARKLRRQGYPVREIGRRLNVSHTAVLKWTR